MKPDSLSKLSATTISLHWIVAVMMILLLATGIYMEQTEAFALYPWHKAFGVLILLFVVIRIVWRIKQGWPKPVGDYSALEKTLSKIVHWLLILATLIMPVSGFMMSSLGGYGIDFFGFELVAKNTNPSNPMEIVPINEAIANFAHIVHELAGYVLLLAVILHLVGALKHHILDKDATIRRMLGHEV